MKILDYFHLQTHSLDEILDSSLDPAVIRKRLIECKNRNITESVFRVLYKSKIIGMDSPYTTYLCENDNVIFFELNVTKFLKENPTWQDPYYYSCFFTSEQQKVWENVIKSCEEKKC